MLLLKKLKLKIKTKKKKADPNIKRFKILSRTGPKHNSTKMG